MSEITKGTPDRREKLFGGEGGVTVWNLLGRQSAPPFSAVLSCELDPNGSVGTHVQQADPEIVVGVAGEGEASINGEIHPLRAGDVVFLPLGSTLAIRNKADTPLRYLIIKARA